MTQVIFALGSYAEGPKNELNVKEIVTTVVGIIERNGRLFAALSD
jgi:hypothetical protein